GPETFSTQQPPTLRQQRVNLLAADGGIFISSVAGLPPRADRVFKSLGVRKFPFSFCLQASSCRVKREPSFSTATSGRRWQEMNIPHRWSDSARIEPDARIVS